MLHKLLPERQDFKAMQVVALLTRLGWEEDCIQEGQAVAKFMEISWSDVQDSIQRQFNEGLVSKQGRYRYVTPHLLAVWLAVEAWEARGEGLLQLLSTLPTWNSRHAMLSRLRDLGDHPRAHKVVETLLNPDGIFQDMESINDERRAEVFSLLAEVNPRAGLDALERLLLYLPRDELLRFYEGRQPIIRLLSTLAWHQETFFRAARLLQALAEAENQHLLNNATGVWAELFLTYLGPTVVPALERHPLIAEALESDSTEKQRLAIRAIEKALSSYETRGADMEEPKGRILPSAWQPRDREEALKARLSALTLLDSALASHIPEVRKAAQEVLIRNAGFLLMQGLGDAVLERLASLSQDDETNRRGVWNSMQAILRTQGERLSQQQRARIEALCDSLTDHSFRERLRRWLGKRTISDWHADGDPSHEIMEQRVHELAEEAFRTPGLLEPELDWLFSEEAITAYPFAQRLGELDSDHLWWSELERRVLAVQSSPFVAAYLQGQVNAGRRDWREALLDRWVQEGKEKALAVLDVIWRGETDDRDAQRLITLLEQGSLPAEHLSLLVWGGKTKVFSTPIFQRLVTSILRSSDAAAAQTAVILIADRLGFCPDERDNLEEQAWCALERSAYAVQPSMFEYRWNELAKRYLEKSPVRIARLLLHLFREEAEANTYIRESDALQTFMEATRLAPAAIWEEVGALLLQKGNFATLLRLRLSVGYALAIPPSILLDWAERHRPRGPQIVAGMVSVGKVPLDDLAREMLIRYGTDKSVVAAIDSKFGTGAFWGPLSNWYQARLNTAREWLRDPHPAVRKWVQRQVDMLEKQLPLALLQEEEEALVR